MNQEKIGKFIKDLRKKNNLTQKDLADKYGVTYQAVSKWENGKNIPDISLIRQMSKDFNVDVLDILDGNISKKNRFRYVLIFVLIIIVILIMMIFIKNKDTYNFKTISTTCNDFNVTGSIAYDNDKASIYISNINYCGKEDNTIYKSISCSLYEKDGKTTTLINECDSVSNSSLTNYINDIKLNIDNYLKVCKKYTDDSLYLEINAINDDDITVNYKIPLKLNDNCK